MNPRMILPAWPVTNSTHHTDRAHDRARLTTYIIIAVVALMTGLVLGSLSAPAARESRVGWPAPTGNPRSLHP